MKTLKEFKKLAEAGAEKLNDKDNALRYAHSVLKLIDGAINEKAMDDEMLGATIRKTKKDVITSLQLIRKARK